MLYANRRRNHGRNRNEIFVQSSDWTNMKYAAARHMKCTTGFHPKSSVHEISAPTCAGADMVELAPSRRLLYAWEDGCWIFLILGIQLHLPKCKNPRFRGFFLSIGRIFCIIKISVTNSDGPSSPTGFRTTTQRTEEGGTSCLLRREEVNRMITFGDFLQFLHLLIDLVEFALGIGSTKKK